MPDLFFAKTAEDYTIAERLFREYAASLPIDLSFQDFENELEILPEIYGLPAGRLLLFREAGDTVGCIGLRRLSSKVAEVKRMYVQPGYRDKGFGKLLLDKLINEATAMGYHRLRLDTLSNMHPAISLYKSFGFVEVPPYYHNPNVETVYFEKRL